MRKGVYRRVGKGTKRRKDRMDNLLHIRTTGRMIRILINIDIPYEPTPYSVLERLANSDILGKKEYGD